MYWETARNRLERRIAEIRNAKRLIKQELNIQRTDDASRRFCQRMEDAKAALDKAEDELVFALHETWCDTTAPVGVTLRKD